MDKYIRYILNHTGFRPHICRTDKDSWRATLKFYAGKEFPQGRGETKTMALIDLAKKIGKMKKKS